MLIKVNKSNIDDIVKDIEAGCESDLETCNIVADIILNIRNKGDEALFEYTKKFDGFSLSKENINFQKKK